MEESNGGAGGEAETARGAGELPERLATLDIVEGGGEVGAAAPEREGESGRVLRKRKPIPAGGNRRAQSTPRKRVASDALDLEQLYLNKKSKLSARALETIAEEEGAPGGCRKLKRHIAFAPPGRPAKDKVTKRRQRIRKLLSDGFLTRTKIPMHVFLRTIGAAHCLDAHS